MMEHELEHQHSNKCTLQPFRINPFFPLLEISEVDHNYFKKETNPNQKPIIKKKNEEKIGSKSLK